MKRGDLVALRRRVVCIPLRPTLPDRNTIYQLTGADIQMGDSALVLETGVGSAAYDLEEIVDWVKVFIPAGVGWVERSNLEVINEAR